MKSLKSFVMGVIFGTLFISGIGYAAQQLHMIEVSFPKITYWLDGKQLNMGMNHDLPETIQYRGVNYVPVRNLAENLQKEVEWNGTRQEVHLYSVQPLRFEKVEHLSPPLKQWIENSKVVESAQVQTINGHTYILVTLGEKNTGGYMVEVKEIKQYVDRVSVIVEKSEPQTGALVTEVIDYPYTLIEVTDQFHGTLEFVDTKGNVLPTLIGIDVIPSLKENTDHLLLFEPHVSEDTIVIDGIVQAFEGFVVFSWSDANGEIMTQETIQASGAKPDWGYFSKKIPLDEVPIDSSLILQAVDDYEEMKNERIQLNFQELLMTR